MVIYLGNLQGQSHLVVTFLHEDSGAGPCQAGKIDTMEPITTDIWKTSIWQWLKTPVPKWNLGKWKHGPKPAVCPSCLNFEPQPELICFLFLMAKGQVKQN